MNSFNVTEKSNSAGQRSLSFGARMPKKPEDILRHARALADGNKINKGAQRLYNAFNKALKTKDNGQIVAYANNLIGYYMVEMPSNFIEKVKGIREKLYKNVGEIGLKSLSELDQNFPSIRILGELPINKTTAKKMQRQCVDNLTNGLKFEYLYKFFNPAKGQALVDEIASKG